MSNLNFFTLSNLVHIFNRLRSVCSPSFKMPPTYMQMERNGVVLQVEYWWNRSINDFDEYNGFKVRRPDGGKVQEHHLVAVANTIAAGGNWSAKYLLEHCVR